jgi:hypothetical protein
MDTLSQIDPVNNIIKLILSVSFLLTIFAYICTGVNETIANWLKRRPTYLLESIRQLLDEDNNGHDGLIKEFYQHPQIQSLYPKSYWYHKILNFLLNSIPKYSYYKNLEENVVKANLPSYIDSGTFYNVLIDIIKNKFFPGQEDFNSLEKKNFNVKQ